MFTFYLIISLGYKANLGFFTEDLPDMKVTVILIKLLNMMSVIRCPFKKAK